MNEIEMDESTPDDLKETGAGNGDLSQTDVIDYATFKDVNGKPIDPPTSSRSSRKKRKVQVDGVDHAHDVNQDEKLSDDEYKHRVAYALEQNKKNLDLDEVNARLKENPSLYQTSSERSSSDIEVNANNIFQNGKKVPSGAALCNQILSSTGNGNKRLSFSEKRRNKPLKLSPTLVNDESVFNWGRAVGDTKNDGYMDSRIDKSNENSKNKIPTEDEKSSNKEAFPSSVLERGTIFFFNGPTVNAADQTQGIEDVARTFFALRPFLPKPIEKDSFGDNRDAGLFSLSKKKWPKSMQDKLLCFVDKAVLGIKELKEYLASRSKLSLVKPNAEGRYAIIYTDRKSYLAYYTFYPHTLEVWDELGINKKGSFVCSIENPTVKDLANATIDNPARYTEELQEKFRNLRWGSLIPGHLTDEGTQMLIFGEEQSVDSKKEESTGPEDEKNTLDQEDHDRAKGLKEDDPIFTELILSAKESSHMQTTW